MTCFNTQQKKLLRLEVAQISGNRFPGEISVIFVSDGKDPLLVYKSYSGQTEDKYVLRPQLFGEGLTSITAAEIFQLAHIQFVFSFSW